MTTTTPSGGFNLAVDHHRELIVGAVSYASARGLAVGVATTGHGPAVPADGQVLISTPPDERRPW